MLLDRASTHAVGRRVTLRVRVAIRVDDLDAHHQPAAAHVADDGALTLDFAQLPREARAHLRRFAAGETIFLMDAPGDSMMAILEGSVRISVPSPDGKEIVLALLHPGEVFGEIALLDGKGRTADARGMSG